MQDSELQGISVRCKVSCQRGTHAAAWRNDCCSASADGASPLPPPSAAASASTVCCRLRRRLLFCLIADACLKLLPFRCRGSAHRRQLLPALLPLAAAVAAGRRDSWRCCVRATNDRVTAAGKMVWETSGIRPPGVSAAGVGCVFAESFNALTRTDLGKQIRQGIAGLHASPASRHQR